MECVDNTKAVRARQSERHYFFTGAEGSGTAALTSRLILSALERLWSERRRFSRESTAGNKNHQLSRQRNPKDTGKFALAVASFHWYMPAKFRVYPPGNAPFEKVVSNTATIGRTQDNTVAL